MLDTHVLLWWLADTELSESAVAAITSPRNEVAVSAASAWEIAIKRLLGKLQAPHDLQRQLELGGFVELAISVAHAIAAGGLPRHHEDPFDRMLIAQAMAEDLTIVTRDARFSAYGVPLLVA